MPSRAQEILRPTENQSSGSVLRPACQERCDGFAMACLGLLQTALPKAEGPAPYAHGRGGFLNRETELAAARA